MHEAHGSNVLLDRTFVWGEVEKDFAASPHKLKHRVKWGRSSTVPIETFGVTASWDPWREILDVWASIQMPKYPDQTAMALKMPMSSVRVHYDVDVGGSYGVKRGIKHTVLVGYLSRRLGVPVRLIEDRLENMRGGDMHGPERIFDVEVAFDDQGIIRSMKMRALDNVGAYAGRSPFQLGKPVGAIVGPYKIKSVQYQAIAVVTNKTVQEAVRAFGQSPTNYAHRAHHRRGGEPARPRPARSAPPQHDPPRGVSVSDPERLDLRLRRLPRRDRQGAGARRLRRADRRARPAARGRACSPASASRRAWSRAAAIRRSSRCSIPKIGTTTWMDSCRISVDLVGSITATMHTTSAGQGHETHGRHRGRRGAGGRSRQGARGARRTRSIRCRATARSAAAWRSCSAARRSTRRSKIKDKLIAIAAHDLGVPVERIAYKDGNVFDTSAPDKKRTWAELVTIAHRHIHKLPPGMEPGLSVSHIMPVPTGGGLPTADGRVQMYPCYSFEFHLMLVAIDPDLGKPEIKRYVIGHDCGTVINPKIVRGMTMGGIAHGIGAALYEEFAYNDDGLLVAQNFMDYLLPSAHEVPPVEIVASRDAVAAHRVRPEGLRRERLSRRAGGGRQRGQRRGPPARHRGQLASYQSGAAWRYDRRRRARKAERRLNSDHRHPRPSGPAGPARPPSARRARSFPSLRVVEDAGGPGARLRQAPSRAGRS